MTFADLLNGGFDRPCHIHPSAFARRGGFASPAREPDSPREFLHKKVEFFLLASSGFGGRLPFASRWQPPTFP